MGRKPNQLILEFFERGPKLEDASNRYQHTCKSCGEKFPKGRIDSLTNHLVKKCPALPLRDRQRAILQFHELPDLPENMAHAANASSQGQNGQTMSLPFAPKQGMSALETLAEVSRQHLDLSDKHAPGGSRSKSSPRMNGMHNGGLLDEFLVQDDRPEGTDIGSISDRHDWADTSNAPALPSIYQYGPLQNSPIGSPHLGSLPLTSAPMAQMVPSLVMAASAANELQSLMAPNGLTMEPELGVANAGITDKYFHNTHGRPPWPNVQANAIDPMLQDNGREHSVPQDGFTNRAASYPRPIAMNPNTQTHFTTDFSMNQKPAKPKVRGRFSDSRRKEVQEVRKRGACIRCRMLKKPCSGENPCSTCVNVESARLWKQPCIRTRIAEEFNVYSAGLHSVLAFHAVSQAKGQIQLDQIPGRIEVTHYVDSSIFATFAPLKCQRLPSSAIDPALLGNGKLSLESFTNLEIIDSDTDDISGKLEQYVKRLDAIFHESESSAFMKTTVAIAFSLSSTNKDGLLSRVLELWIATRILVEHSLEWHLFSNPSLPPAMAPAEMSQSDLENSARTPITPINNRESYDLIKAQLMGAMEKRAATLSKFVMNDLERRLLQRQQVSPFETFLVAVILLACVERMCWLFKTWEVGPGPLNNNTEFKIEQATSEGDIAQALQAPQDQQQQQQQQQRRNARWPLDKQPAYYSQQGERFSDIMLMLLRMRGVPPKIRPRHEDGVLALSGEDADPTAKEWYDKIGFTNEGLIERLGSRYVGIEPGEWECKYVGKIVRGGIVGGV
ncbi:hypothetical protein K432DRAFT_382024 [Lepidopterella palustris CBS 459.81]|uniref:Zn(2)-C6 fungal-type domain-containing protein n=1 Tax=Lepidopterella palustris CBS 459.81 TaxID=1314670 RepID=A0A8E2EAV4_9PEZI|nr:hypothetical protein K432DRAFT_382024 [Lepidopterella palustris CBS 459.81]